MDVLYGIDALLGIVVSLATLAGLAGMYFRGRGGGGPVKQASDAPSGAAHPSSSSGKKRRFPFMTLLLIGAMGIGALFIFRGFGGGRDGAWGPSWGSGGRYERERPRWPERRERRPRWRDGR